MKNDVYKSSTELQRELERYKNIDFTGENREIAMRFKDLLLNDDLRDVTRKDHLQSIRILAPHIDFDLKTADKSDIQTLVRKINDDHIRKRNGEPYAAWSKKDLRASLKKLYRLALNKHKLVSFFRTHPKHRDKPKLQAIDIPPKEDVNKLAALIDDELYTAVLWFHWSAGLRIKELMNLKRGGIRRHKGRYWIDVPEGEKTGPRSIPILRKEEQLETLIDRSKEHGQHFLLHDKHGKPMSYDAYEQQFRKAARHVDTPAILTPKMMRKSRATNMAGREDVNAPKLKKYFGWSDLDTAEWYIQLGESALEDLAANTPPEMPALGSQQTHSPAASEDAPADMYA